MMTSFADHLQNATDSALMGADAPFSAHLSSGLSRLCVVTGGNATGKSLYVRILQSRTGSQNILPISISIRERTGSGLHEMAGMRRAMMFGDESEQSTGATSISTVQQGFSNLKSHAKEREALLILDEPELGLSEDYAAAMGAWLARETLACANPQELGVVVVTHSRVLVRALANELASVGQTPHFVCMDAPQSLHQWLDNPVVRSVDELLDLPRVGHERRRAVASILNAKKATPQAAQPASSKPKNR